MRGGSPSSSIPTKPAHVPRGIPRASKRTRWRVLALVLVHLAVLGHILHWWTTGSSLSPVEPSEAFRTLTYGVVNAGFVLLALSIVATLVLGRFFCGWACHVVAYQDFCASLLGRFGLRPKPVRSRLLSLVPIFAAIDIFVLPGLMRWFGSGEPGAVGWSLTWQPTTDSLWATFPGPAMALLTLAVDGLLVVWFFGSKGFCTYGCPYGALFGAADRLSPGRVRVTDACEGCGHCTATCTSNVDVHREVARFGMVVDAGCMRCLDCVSVCPKDALYFGFGAPPLLASLRSASSTATGAPAKLAAGAHEASQKPKKERRPKTRRTYDFSWPEELGMAAVFAGALFAFRSLYSAVPFLLAIGLAVIAALTAIIGTRLLAKADLRFQHWDLRAAGRLTGAGFLAMAFVPTYLGFTGHSAFVQYQLRQGIHWNEEARLAQPGSPGFERAVAHALEHFRLVERFGLVATTELHNRIGQLLAHTPDREGAMSHLKAALALDDGNSSTHAALAEVLVLEGRKPEALEHYLRAVELDPGEPRTASGLLGLLLRAPTLRPEAEARLTALVSSLTPPASASAAANQLVEAHARLAELLVVELRFDEAVPELAFVLDREPRHVAAGRCLAALLRREPAHPAANELAGRTQARASE